VKHQLMRGEKTRRNICSDQAVTDVIATILSVSIVLSVAAGIMLWGEPLINGYKADAISEEVERNINTAIANIEDIIHETPGSTRTFNIDAKEGVFDINSAGDRLVLSYATLDGYDFSVSGLDDGDENFQISTTTFPDDGLLAENHVFSHVNIYWFPDDPLITFNACDQISFIDFFGQSCSMYKFDISPIYDLDEPIKLQSVKIRWTSSTPLKEIEPAVTPYKTSIINSQDWSSDWEYTELTELPTDDERAKTNLYIGPSYIETQNILHCFSDNYNDKNQFFSIGLANDDYQIKSPYFCIDYPFFCNYYHLSKYVKDFSGTPELIINYIKLPSELPKEEKQDEKILEEKKENTKIYRFGSTHKEARNNNIINNDYYIDNQELLDTKYGYKIDNGIYSAFFNDYSSPDQQDTIVIQREGYALSSKPGDVLDIFSEKFQNKCSSGIEKKYSIAIAKGNMITYPDQYGTGIDLSYHAFDTILKEELVIADCSLLPTSSFENGYLALPHHINVYNPNSEQSLHIVYGEEKKVLQNLENIQKGDITTSEPLFFIDDQNNILFCLPEIFAWDSSNPINKIQLKRTIRLINDNELIVWIQTPYSWLTDESTTYPVIIDDSIYSYTIGDSCFRAKYNMGGDWLPTDENPPTGFTQYNSGQILKIEQDDSLQNNWQTTISGKHVSLWYEIDIFSNIGDRTDIQRITVNWVGFQFGEWNFAGGDLFLYIWNYNSNTWDEKISAEKTWVPTYYMYTIPFGDIDTYVTEDREFDVLVVGGWENMYTIEDFIEVIVTYISEPDPPSEPSPADDELNVELDPQLSIKVEDPDEDDLLDVEFWFAKDDGSALALVTTFDDWPSGLVSTNPISSYPGFNILEEDGDYKWQVKVKDHTAHHDWVSSDEFLFSTVGEISITWVEPSDNYLIFNSDDMHIEWQQGLTSPNLEYKYKLDGYVDSWSAWTTATSVYYYDLPDNDYVFRLQYRKIEEPAIQNDAFRIFIVPIFF